MTVHFRMVECINVRRARPPRVAHLGVHCRGLAETPLLILRRLWPPALPTLHSSAPRLHHLDRDPLPVLWKIP